MHAVVGITPLAQVQAYVDVARQGRAISLPEGELGDWIREDVQAGIRNWAAKASGWIYLAENTMYPNLFKIGCTRKSPSERLQSLNSSGVFGRWEFASVYAVYDAFGIERLVHKAAAAQNIQKEFFSGPVELLEQLITSTISLDLACINKAFKPCLGMPVNDFLESQHEVFNH